MKKFKFPLARVLEFRKLELEAETATLETCVRRLRSIEQKQAAIREESAKANDDMRSREYPGALVATAEPAQLPHYRGLLDRRWAEAERERAQAALAVEQQREKLLEARRRFEVLDRCREKAKTKWKAEFLRQQEDLAAELFLAKWKPD